jgi:ADP-heptose:LPS heptosyltransferase
MKILAIQFKYLGDAVFITPALEALHQQYPSAEIHVLVAQEVAPILSHLTYVKKVWGLRRARGKTKLLETLPLLNQLRKEKFDLSIDFAGNDRGATLSLLIGAKDKVAAVDANPKFLQRIAYTRVIAADQLPKVWVARHLKMLSLLLGTPEPSKPNIKIAANSTLLEDARKALNHHNIICHIGTSQQKKEWPISHWLKLYQMAKKAGYSIVFVTGTNQREQMALKKLKEIAPEIFELHPKSLEHYLAFLNEAELIISGDTGPLHFAAALGKKIIGLFAVEDGVKHYAPIYKQNEIIFGKSCTCTGKLAHFPVCQSPSPCMSSITPEQVFELLKKRYPLKPS